MHFRDLNEAQILALAITAEEEDARIYRDFHLATTIALIVVAAELAVIAWIRKRYMDTPLLSAIFQVVVGGVLVFLTGWLIGSG